LCQHGQRGRGDAIGGILGQDVFRRPSDQSVPSLRYQWTKIRDRVWLNTWPDSPPVEW
jgi:hypothetical protein